MIAALALAASVLAAPASAQVSTCGYAGTQMDMNVCAANAAKAADAQLNQVWAKAMGSARGTPAADPLRAAQRAWIGFRDLACQAEAAQYAGGSIAPMVFSQCLERVTRARIADLQQFGEY